MAKSWISILMELLIVSLVTYNPCSLKSAGDLQGESPFSVMNRQVAVDMYGLNHSMPDFKGIPYRNEMLCRSNDSTEVLVRVEEPLEVNCEKVNALLTKNHAKVVQENRREGRPWIIVCEVRDEALPSLKWQLLNEGLARYVEPNIRMRVMAVPNDPAWRLNWGLTKIETDYAWNTTTGESSVVIAIVDTGVDWDHPDLAANIWNNTDEWPDGKDNDGNGFVDDVRGWDFVDTAAAVWLGEDGTERDNDPMDFHGHGTHCAGIAAAVGNNSLGVAGSTWNCRLMPVRAGYEGDDGGGYLEVDDAAAAILYAAGNCANIISCSWGLYYNSQTLYEAVKYAYDAGALVVAAAGNDLTDYKLYPAAYNGVIAVSATDNTDYPALFSNYGDWVDLAAPGTDIYSTVFDDSYDYMSGTSMSAPLVAGIAGLVLSRFPSMNKDQIREQLRFTSDDLGEIGFDARYGYGRINAKRAVELQEESIDIAVSEIQVDSLVVRGEPTWVDVSVLNMGALTENNLQVGLLVNNSLIKSDIIAYLAPGGLDHVRFLWHTSGFAEGHYTLTASVVWVSGEKRVGNNILSKKVFVRQPRVIGVPGDFLSIQEAVDNASKGDTIAVAAGTWGSVILYKDCLKLVGGPNTVIDANRHGDAILVMANDVLIRDFIVTNAWAPSRRDQPFSGVYVYYGENVKITNVYAQMNVGGIFLYCSHNVTLSANRMRGNKFNFGIDGSEVSNFHHNIDNTNTVEEKPLCYIADQSHKQVSGTIGCLILVNCTDIEAAGLHLSQNYAGVACVACRNISLIDTESSSNNIGISIRNCASSIVNRTYISSNYVGIATDNSETIVIENSFVGDAYAFGDGVRFEYSTDCMIRSNNLSKNRVCLMLYHSDRNEVAENRITKATSGGIRLAYSDSNILTQNELFDNKGSIGQIVTALEIVNSTDNMVYHNSFISNTENVFHADSTTIFDDGYPSGGNYWSNYIGIDEKSGPDQNETGNDQIGDTPYLVDEASQDHYPLLERFPCIHAIVLKDVKPDKTSVGQDRCAKIFVDLANLGHFIERVKVTLYANSTTVDVPATVIIAARNCASLAFSWNTSGVSIGNYTIKASADPVAGELYLKDNTCVDGVIMVRPPTHDVAVTAVKSEKTVVGLGCSMIINITLENKGGFFEVLNLSIYANTTAIDTLSGIALSIEELKTVSCIWTTEGFAEGNYTLSVYADPVPNEINLADNGFVDGWFILSMVGDITGSEGLPDGKVDIRDIALIACNFGKLVPPAPANCDITGPIRGLPDGKIDIRDIAITAKNFGKSAFAISLRST